ncbi:MAG: glycosyltransferase, partial [Terricaulis sp.]
MPRGQAALLWLRHVLDAEIATRTRPRAILTYDALLADWRAVLSQISEKLSMRWKHAPTDVEPQVDAFLSGARRHHKSSAEDLLVDPMLRTWIADTYSALLVLERNPQSETALETLDRIRETFNAAAPIIQQFTLEATEARAVESLEYARAIESERETAHQRIAEIEQTSEALVQQLSADTRREIETLNAEIDSLRETLNRERVASADSIRALEIAALDARAEHIALQERADAANAARQAYEDAANAALQEAASVLSATRAELSERDAALYATRAEVRRRTAVVASLEGALGAARLDGMRLRAAVDEGRRQREGLEARLAEKDRAIAAAQAEIERREARRQAEAGAAQARDAEHQAVASELHAARARADDLASSLEQAGAETERLRGEVQARDEHLHAMGSSTSWRMTRPIRGVKRLLTDSNFRRQLPTRLLGSSSVQPLRRWTLPWALHVTNRLAIDGRYRAGALSKINRVLQGRYGEDVPVSHGAPVAPLHQIEPSLRETRVLQPYEAWLRANALSEADRVDLRDALALRAGRTPKLSAIMPVYNSDPRLLREIVVCVRAQIYENWELCIVDDCSPAEHVRPLLKEIARLDKRIKIKNRDVNGGIAEATNTAVSMADGDIVVFIDHDDLITPDCFAELALYYADHSRADVVYS